MKKLSVFILVGLLIGSIFQAANLSAEYGPNLLAIRNNLGKSGLWRGANFNQSQKVADYIEFLNLNIPENSRVILPSLGGDSKVLVNPYMQFFLAPREILNCTNIECLQSMSREDSYFLIVGKFPADLFPDALHVLFDDQWGIVPPENLADENLLKDASFTNLGAILLAGIFPLLWITVITLSGAALVSLLIPGKKCFLYAALGYSLGLSIFSIGITLVNLLGFKLDRPLILIVTGIIFVFSLSIFAVNKRKFLPIHSPPRSETMKGNFDIWPIILTALGGIVLILAVGKGYHRIDAIQIWGVKGYGIAADGSLKGVTNWGTNTLAYPLHIPVLIAGFRILFGDILPSSKLIFGGYYLAILIVGYYSLLKMGIRRSFAGLAVLFLFTTPILFRHGTIGYANLPLAFYLLSGVVLFLPVFSGCLTKGNVLLSGLFFVCAAWTRPEGLILSFCCVGFLLLLVLFKKNLSFGYRKLISFLGPLLIYFLLWKVIMGQIYPEPLSKTSLIPIALTQIMMGKTHINDIYFILRFVLKEMMSLNVWGIFGSALLLAWIPVLFFLKSVTTAAKMMIATGGLLIAMIIGMYFLTSFDPEHDLSWWVTSGLNRMLFPGVIILWLGIIGAYRDLLSSKKYDKKQYPNDWSRHATNS